jgi:hypothetical protein
MEKTVKYLQNTNFGRLTPHEKLRIKETGRPTPQIVRETKGKSRGKPYTRSIKFTTYGQNSWITGCEEKNALFCFPCILFGGVVEWTKTGVTDLPHLKGKIVKHENSPKHTDNMVSLAMLGKVNMGISHNSFSVTAPLLIRLCHYI